MDTTTKSTRALEALQCYNTKQQLDKGVEENGLNDFVKILNVDSLPHNNQQITFGLGGKWCELTYITEHYKSLNKKDRFILMHYANFLIKARPWGYGFIPSIIRKLARFLAYNL